MIFRSPLRMIAILGILAYLLVILCACSSERRNVKTSTDPLVSSPDTSGSSLEQTTASSLSDEGNKDVLKIDTYINLNNSGTTINGNGASFNNNTLTITQPGTYSIKGTLEDGKIYVNTEDESQKVKLYLNGVSISCSTDAPIFIENSPLETVIISAEGSVNTLSDTARTIAEELSDYATAVIYSKDDLQLEGSGTININAAFNKGIFSKNDIDIRGGTINITSVDDGIRGKDSVEISEGTLNISCGGDGIRTSEESEENKGYISISSGNITIDSDLDCIQAVSSLTVSGGTLKLVSNGGSTGASSNQDSAIGMGTMGGMGGMPPGTDRGGRGDVFNHFGTGAPMPNDSSFNEATEQDTPSCKGLKAGTGLNISGGSISVSATDDALRAADISISAGRLLLASDDDGIHADETVTIDKADIDITYSYEGIEGRTININGGDIHLLSSDDGFNASGDSQQSATDGMGGMGGMKPMQSDGSCCINISDGFIYVNAEGDGVDSNGNVNMTGGTLIVCGPVSGANAPLDYGGSFTVSGGTLLATGSAGMAQSVTGDGVQVLAFTYSCAADVLTTVTDSEDKPIIGFVSPKSYGVVIFASDKFTADSQYKVYSGGSFDTEDSDGVYLEGNYTKGELIGALS